MTTENTSASRVLLRARANGAFAQGPHKDTAQGVVRRAIFALGTILFLVAYGAISLACFLTSDKWRKDLREGNGGEG